MKKVRITDWDLEDTSFNKDTIYKALKVEELTLEQINNSIEDTNYYNGTGDYFIINPDNPSQAIYFADDELNFIEED